MAKLARVLWGYRDDLKLWERWWHRLAKVLFVLLTVTAAATVAYAVTDETPSPTKANVTVIRTLDEHRRLDKGYVVPTFVALPGRIGVLNNDGSIGQWLHEYEVGGGECRSDEPSPIGTAVTLKREPNKFDETLNQMFGKAEYEDYKGYIIPDTVGGKTGHCFLPLLSRNGGAFKPIPVEPDPLAKYRVPDKDGYLSRDPNYGLESGLPLEILTADRIVKWKYSPRAYVGLTAFLTGVFSALLILLLNAYYRGIIYIAFGPRKSPPVV